MIVLPSLFIPQTHSIEYLLYSRSCDGPVHPEENKAVCIHFELELGFRIPEWNKVT